jgi:hypothetical protein
LILIPLEVHPIGHVVVGLNHVVVGINTVQVGPAHLVNLRLQVLNQVEIGELGRTHSGDGGVAVGSEQHGEIGDVGRRCVGGGGGEAGAIAGEAHKGVVVLIIVEVVG